ncbi:hypothetical protein MOBT1_000412 [Malassezia obtusa]|uniref:Uncharacterized protein n=1 Tax=Malassezia obtusa TaxID=76774 RepID=A0AAF0DY21_9BASI|nr:hypothetical protein MOBT1_000412 [Malassezia obtusa]
MPRAVYTALVVLLLRPAAAVDAQRMQRLQRIRHTYDAAYTRWLPHITLIPPFQLHAPDGLAKDDVPAWLSSLLDGLSDDTARACARHARHRVSLSEIGVFRLRRYENIHLRPSEASAPPLLALQRDVQLASTPHIPKAKRKRESFIPHASLGQAYSPEDRADIELEATRDCALAHGGLTVAVDNIQ